MLQRIKRCCKFGTKNQRGQAIVELTLMMTFLAMILLALVIISELGAKNISVIESLRNEMRKSISDSAWRPFQIQKILTPNSKIHEVVNIPGKMKQVLGTPSITIKQKIVFYEGSYNSIGVGHSQYNNRGKLYRKTDLQN